MNELKTIQEKALIRIVDDEQDLRKGLSFLLGCAGWKSAGYKSAKDFLRNDSPSVPGCLILDVQMPDISGIELQHEMIRRNSPLPVVFLSGHGDIDMAVQAIQEGAVHFLQKPVDSARLLAVIEKAVRKSLEESPVVTDSTSARHRLSLLTEREREVIGLVAQGLSSRQIATRFGISERTVEAHRSSANKKLHVSSTSDELKELLKQGEQFSEP
ncbi:response regulator [Mesosutterella sp. OilRF-GAM-744-9]|uniref:Response regulator n=1 Tax=Mesosutterella porci TaxID=2915351 RepID=A0ABS9MQC9_9BURK|nr:response regulator [Mesosutterella sp. oilRF-744-WT-GAM-9]MCG5030544.1 response regulator [Mesosutterella sp. oilRF-744-WT-GAM-9]